MSDRDNRGRFLAGNRGRPKGSTNKAKDAQRALERAAKILNDKDTDK